MPSQIYRQIGTVLKRVKGFYYVDIADSVHLCRIKGNLFQGKNKKNTVAVGDRVEIDLDAADDAGWIYKILPRRSQLSRPINEGKDEQVLISNVDHLLIVSSIKNPPFRSGMVDRYLITAQLGGLSPTLILNKVDLGEAEAIHAVRESYQTLGYPVLLTSTISRVGLDCFHELLKNHTCVLSGHSGVGKSSLLKALYPQWNIEIGRLSSITQKGRHTTSMPEMHRLPGGGYVADTPGIRELGLSQVVPGELDQYFVEFEQARLQCRFKGCTHRHEPDCGVRHAVAEKKISPIRYQSYCSIFASLQKIRGHNTNFI